MKLGQLCKFHLLLMFPDSDICSELLVVWEDANYRDQVVLLFRMPLFDCPEIQCTKPQSQAQQREAVSLPCLLQGLHSQTQCKDALCCPACWWPRWPACIVVSMGCRYSGGSLIVCVCVAVSIEFQDVDFDIFSVLSVATKDFQYPNWKTPIIQKDTFFSYVLIGQIGLFCLLESHPCYPLVCRQCHMYRKRGKSIGKMLLTGTKMYFCPICPHVTACKCNAGHHSLMHNKEKLFQWSHLI